jgi:NTE family protein
MSTSTESGDASPGRTPLGPITGLALGGGGARAAYQVGILRYLARAHPETLFPVVTGVSAGGINAALLASHHGTFPQAVEELSGLWSQLEISNVFRTDPWSLARIGMRWILRLASGGTAASPSVRGLVDTAPLRRYLTEALHPVDGELTGVDYNILQGKLRALALSTVNYTTGTSVTWVQGSEIQDWERPMRRSRQTRLTVDHVMASAALPLFFPATRIGQHWFGDGGVRLTAPLSPAIHLGATRILALSTRYLRTLPEGEEELIQGYPPPAQILGVLMNAVFLDLLDQDAMRLELTNRLLARLDRSHWMGLRPIRLLVIRPSRDLGKLAADLEPELPRSFRFLTRGLGTRETRSSDALSLILFQHDYLRRIMDLGEQDAEARAADLEDFFEAPAHPDPPGV